MIGRVALGLGKSVVEVLAMQAAEFDFWCGFFAAEPFGPRQQTHEAGVVALAAASAFGGARGLTPADFFPSLKTGEAKGGGFRAWASARCPALANRPTGVAH